MVSTLLNTDTCVGIGKGMVTSWTLSGLTAAYDGTAKASSDGYKIVASMTFVSTAAYGTNGTETDLVTSVPGVMGTCVETLDSAGTRVASAITDDGNNAICHWIYLSTGTPMTAQTASSGTGWGDTKYLTYAQWGTTSGAGIIGSKVKTTGTAIGTTHAFALTPTTLVTFIAGTYSNTWYQPTFAATYLASALRRYNGGTSDADKVKAYCVALRKLSTATVLSPSMVVAADKAGTTGTVTLAGATALVAGIAYGVSALAF